MRKVCLAIVLVLCSFACKERSIADTELLSAAEQSISLCVNEYTRLSGNALLDEFGEVDRVYVHVTTNQFGVLFAHGEVGTFGERSSDYQAYMSCGVLESNGLKIYYMSARTHLGTLIKDPNFDAIYDNFYKGKVKELFYKRSGDEFIFVAAQDQVDPDSNSPRRLD